MTEWISAFFGSIAVVFVGLVAKRHTSRIDKIEEKVQKSVTPEIARQLISDKLDPLKSDYRALHHRITRIETKIDTVIDLQLRDKK